MKLGPAIKLGNKNKTTSKKIDNDFMLANCDVTVIFPIFDHLQQFETPIPDAWYIKLTFSLMVTFYFTKTEHL